MSVTSNAHATRAYISPEAREMLHSLKRGGETYDDLLREMVAQYDVEAAPDEPGDPVPSDDVVGVPCSHETREMVSTQKRYRENYDSVVRKMAEQYDPEKAAENAARTKNKAR
jgi:hypothetical protein